VKRIKCDDGKFYAYLAADIEEDEKVEEKDSEIESEEEKD